MKTFLEILKNPFKVAGISMVSLAVIMALSVMLRIRVITYMLPVLIVCIMLYTVSYCLISLWVCFNEEEQSKNE